MGLLGTLYAFHNDRLIDATLSKKFLRKQIYKLLFGMVLLGAAIGLSFQYPWVSIGIVVVNVLLYLLPPDIPEYAPPLESGGNSIVR
jgi:hypothetical protein